MTGSSIFRGVRNLKIKSLYRSAACRECHVAPEKHAA